MKKSLFKLLWLCLCPSLCAAPFVDRVIPWQDRTPYEPTTERFLRAHPYEEIEAALKWQGIILRQKSFLDRVTAQEERGHIGYSASDYHFRIFQDIIRIVLEEILELEFKKDFYFFRLPDEEGVYDFHSGADFLANHPLINDNMSNQRDQLISMNFTPYGNYKQKFECTAVFFEHAISYRPPDFKQKIINLFEALGIHQDHIKLLFSISEMIRHPKAGILFQFFDLSHQTPNYKMAYEFVDQFAYPAIKKGTWLPTITGPFSKLFLATSETNFNHQYRLVITHSEFLNPYSSLYIRRYDLNDPATVKSYEEKLRAIIRQQPFDAAKVQQYKNKLLSYWGITLN